MTQRNNILQELNELNSQLVNAGTENIYAVPAGYFDGLIARVMSRIKAMEATNATDELGHLSPVLSRLSKQTPYTVPAGYFEGLSEKMMQSVRESSDYQTVAEETESISPLLAGLKKDMPFAVPQGYFENLTGSIATKENKQEAKVISLTNRKWFRYAAAAVVVSVIATIGFVLIKKEKVTPNEDSYAWVKKNIKKVSTENLEEFIQLADAEKSVASAEVKTQEVKELIKDVPEDEIQSLLNDVKILEEEDSNNASEETLMN